MIMKGKKKLIWETKNWIKNQSTTNEPESEIIPELLFKQKKKETKNKLERNANLFN
jgi:hypothetical protein